MLGMKRTSQWDGHAVENMFWRLNLKWIKFQNVMHVCSSKKKLNDQIKRKTRDHFQ